MDMKIQYTYLIDFGAGMTMNNYQAQRMVSFATGVYDLLTDLSKKEANEFDSWIEANGFDSGKIEDKIKHFDIGQYSTFAIGGDGIARFDTTEPLTEDECEVVKCRLDTWCRRNGYQFNSLVFNKYLYRVEKTESVKV